MSQTLQTIPVPGATPIANNSSSSKAFVNDYFKLNVPNLSNKDRKTIWILGMIYELAHNGGANYKAAHKALVQDAQVWMGQISQPDLVTGLTADAWSAGNSADATLPADLGTLLAGAPALQNEPEQFLDTVIIFLRAQLGV